MLYTQLIMLTIYVFPDMFKILHSTLDCTIMVPQLYILSICLFISCVYD